MGARLPSDGRSQIHNARLRPQEVHPHLKRLRGGRVTRAGVSTLISATGGMALGDDAPRVAAYNFREVTGSCTTGEPGGAVGERRAAVAVEPARHPEGGAERRGTGFRRSCARAV